MIDHLIGYITAVTRKPRMLSDCRRLAQQSTDVGWPSCITEVLAKLHTTQDLPMMDDGYVGSSSSH